MHAADVRRTLCVGVIAIFTAQGYTREHVAGATLCGFLSIRITKVICYFSCHRLTLTLPLAVVLTPTPSW